MNKSLYRKLRNDSNIAYTFKNPDSDTQFLLSELRNEINYLRFLLKDETIDTKERKRIEDDISVSDVLIESMTNE
jgi:hypothetical protein